MEILEDVVKLVARKFSGSSGLGSTDSKYLQGWILKIGCHRKINCISVEYFVDCLANKNPPWAAYRSFISIGLIVLDKLPGVRPVGVRETWNRNFAKCVLRVTGSESTKMCKDDHLCASFKAVTVKAGIWGSSYFRS